MNRFLLFAVLVTPSVFVEGAFNRSYLSSCSLWAATEYGAVCGLRSVYEPLDSNVTEFVSFLAVPYSEQPLGERRFAELGPPAAWDDYLDTRTVGPVCMQYDYAFQETADFTYWDEECIHANVYVPLDALPSAQRLGCETSSSTNRATLRPVIVFIHGGSWSFGAGNPDFYGPEFLVEQGFIVVTFNYRLNVFGFLSLNTSKIPGNAGLRDQVNLLKWVQNNIESFGGDPSDVTLVGQSAGAFSVHLLTLSPASQGLFSRAVLMSGSGVRSVFSSEPYYATVTAATLMAQLNITTTDPDEIYEQLIALPVETINAANSVLEAVTPLILFGAVVETAFDNITTILPDTPENLLAAGYGNNITMLMGFADAECYTFKRRFVAMGLAETLTASPASAVPPYLLYSVDSTDLTTIADLIFDQYFNSGAVELDNLVKYCTDTYFIYPMLYLANYRAALTDVAPTYFYQFSYQGVFRVLQVVNGLHFEGAGHAEDLTYLFLTNSFAYPTLVSRKEFSLDRDMQHWMTSMLVNFTLTSTPDGGSSNWAALESGQLEYQDLRVPNVYNTSSMTSEQSATFDFYNNLYDTYSP